MQQICNAGKPPTSWKNVTRSGEPINHCPHIFKYVRVFDPHFVYSQIKINKYKDTKDAMIKITLSTNQWLLIRLFISVFET